MPSRAWHGNAWQRRPLRLGFKDTCIFRPHAQAALEAYARGVNAFIAGHGGAWPPEFYAARIEPAPWKPADSLVWGRVMALRLTGNNRASAARVLGLSRQALYLKMNRFGIADSE